MSTKNGVKLDRSLSLAHQADLAEGTELTPPKLQVLTREQQGNRKAFEQNVFLQQSPILSRAILWLLLGVTAITIIWANVAQVEEAIPAQGKLEPQGTVKEVHAPVAGVVKAIYVADGQRVHQGDRLLSFDPTATIAQLASLLKVRTALIQENQFYQLQMR